ncbi:MAG: hypothetical protein HDS60_00380, partial [Barnesiella sp.]|nr:hypothetical protein [Barnesiella sp.]
GTAWNGQIYTYENHSEAESEQTPTLTITYYEGDDATETKTHEVKLIDPNSTTGKTMPIKRNNLYRIVLTKATKLDFDLQVLDWDDEEAEIEHPEVPLILPKDVQDSLNRQLLVYDLFTEYNVKSIDFDNKTVEFFDEYVFPTADSHPTSFYSFKNFEDKGALNDFFTDVDNNRFRLPTPGELQLIMPFYARITSDDGFTRYYSSPGFVKTYIYSNDEFQEDVYNIVENQRRVMDKDITTENKYGFSGYSVLAQGRVNQTMTYNENSIFTTDPNNIKTTTSVAPVYGIRFKGTSQYAAYKWEHTYLNDNITNRAIAIYIKALTKDAEIAIEDIVDNHTFWREDQCIKVVLPLVGYYNYLSPFEFKSSTAEYIFITNCYIDDKSLVGVIQGILNQTRCSINNSASSRMFKNLLRFVKVKQKENESAE